MKHLTVPILFRLTLDNLTAETNQYASGIKMLKSQLTTAENEVKEQFQSFIQV